MIIGTTVKHKDRLLRMADLLERDAANDKGVKFDLTTWAQPSERHAHYYTSPDVVPTVDCGTTACAMGLAAISGEFKADGLSWDMIAIGIPGEPAYNLVPLYAGRYTGFSAAQALFGIDFEVAEYLFDPSSYDENPQGAAGELLVASRIRDLVATETYDGGGGDGYDDEGDDDDYGDDDDRPEPADNE